VERTRSQPRGETAVTSGPVRASGDVLETALVSAQAPAADGVARQELLDRLAKLDLGTPRATADRLEGLLASGALSTLRGRQGQSARAVAVGRLLELGYPFALEVAPEDLAHWRVERAPDASDGRGLGLLLVAVASCLSLWGVAEPPRGAGVALVLGITVTAVLTTFRPRAVPWARRALFGLSILACCLAAKYGVAIALPGIAGVIASRLLRPSPVRGVD
jgi:hypothetical protein